MTIRAPQHRCECGNDEFRAVRRGTSDNYRYAVTCTRCPKSKILTADQLIGGIERSRRVVDRDPIALPVKRVGPVPCAICHRAGDTDHAAWCPR